MGSGSIATSWAVLMPHQSLLYAGRVHFGKTDEPTPTRKNVKAVVLYTEDGGQTWVNRAADLEATLPQGEWGWKIQFLNDNIGFVSLENFTAGAILKHRWRDVLASHRHHRSAKECEP